MNNKITVKEDSSNFWKNAFIASSILCAIFFLIYWNISNPFWVSIFRLAAFIFFAIAMLGILKLMNGPLQISLDSSNELLLVSYSKKNKIVKEEQFERKTIKKIMAVEPQENPLLSYLQPNSSTFKISFTDTDRDLYLFEFSGRPLLFSPSSQQKIRNYIQSLNIEI